MAQAPLPIAPIDWGSVYNSSKSFPSFQPPAVSQPFTAKLAAATASIAKDASQTLLVKPAVRIGQAIAAPFVQQKMNATTDIKNQQTDQLQSVLDRLKTTTDPVQRQALSAMAHKLVDQATPNTIASIEAAAANDALGSAQNANIAGANFAIPPQQTGAAGAKQIAGDALKSASYLATPEGLGLTSKASSFTGKLATGAIGGATIGAAGGAGNELENPNSTAGSVLKATGKGALAGAAVGVGTASITSLPAWFKNVRNGPIGEAEGNLSKAQTTATKAEAGLQTAQNSRAAIAPQAVDAYNTMVENVAGHKSSLGNQFRQAAQELETAQPGTTLHLTSQQLSELNAVRENKSFSLPDFLTSKNPSVSIGGDSLDLGRLGPNAQARLQGQLAEMGKQTAVELTPTQTQDLITQLNKATFQQAADGSLRVDQRLVNLTNDIKQSASQAFGSKWDNIYSKYAQGIQAVQKLDDIVNLDRTATASDSNKALQSVLKLSNTPEGKTLLKNAIRDYKAVSGIDLTDPIQTIQQIQAHDDALEAAHATSKEAQKGVQRAQNELETAKANKGQGTKNFAKYIARSAIGGAVRIGILYPAIKAIEASLKN